MLKKSMSMEYPYCISLILAISIFQRKYRKLCGINQTGSVLVSILANLGIQVGSKAINSVLG